MMKTERNKKRNKMKRRGMRIIRRKRGREKKKQR
jgi:hypothetical protein